MLLVHADLERADSDLENGFASFIDVPVSGQVFSATAFVLEGWVASRTAAVRYVEVHCGGTMLRRLHATVDRPDVAAFLRWEGLPPCGFRSTLDLTSAPHTAIDLIAVLSGGERRSLGRVVIRRFWQSSSQPAARDVVSVVIPCFNQAGFLADAIDSALAQHEWPIEVVVVDDGSHDNTAEIAARFPVRYIRQTNQGLAAARNTGIRHTNGDLLIFLDADDRLLPEAAGSGRQLLQENQEAGFVAGAHRCISISGGRLSDELPPIVNGNGYAELLRRNIVGVPAAAVFRRAVLNVVGGFEARFGGCEDYALCLKIARVFPIVTHQAIVAEYRKYGSSMSFDWQRMLRGVMATLAEERPFVRGIPVLESAHAEGIAHWRSSIGGPLADTVRRQLSAPGERLHGLRGLVDLFRFAPGIVPRVLVGR